MVYRKKRNTEEVDKSRPQPFIGKFLIDVVQGISDFHEKKQEEENKEN